MSPWREVETFRSTELEVLETAVVDGLGAVPVCLGLSDEVIRRHT